MTFYCEGEGCLRVCLQIGNSDITKSVGVSCFSVCVTICCQPVTDWPGPLECGELKEYTHSHGVYARKE